MLRHQLAISALVLLLTASIFRVAQAQHLRQDAEAARLVRAMAGQLLEIAPLPGLSVAISRDGRTVFAEGFGFADFEAQRPVTTETRFRAASVSKVIAATALGRLMQEGRIDLDAPIQRYAPSFPATSHPITARHLAGHIAGMSHYTMMDRVEARFYPSITDALSVFAHVPQQSAPRATYRYSTHGFTLLSAAIEGAAETPFLAYVDAAVLKPLGMTSTAADMRASPHAELSALYTLRANRITRHAEVEDPSYKWAGGGFTTTPSDLIRLANGYLNGFLDSATVAQMWKSQELIDGSETGVGLAWRRSWDYAGRSVLEHAGAMQGARSVLSILPERRAAVAVMTNRDWSSAIEITAHMLALPFLDQRPKGAGITGSAEVTVEIVPGQGPPRSVPGVLTLSNGRGTLVAEGVSNALIHVAAHNVYAFIRPTGIYHATLEVVEGTVRGGVMSYGSPQRSPAYTNPPVIRFSGILR